MAKIIKPIWPLVIAGSDEAQCRGFGHPLNDIGRNPSSTFGSRLSQCALGDLRPGSFSTKALHQVSDSEITTVHGTAKHHPCSSIGFDHGPTASRFTEPGCSPRRIANAIASSSRPGTSRPTRSAIVHDKAWISNSLNPSQRKSGPTGDATPSRAWETAQKGLDLPCSNLLVPCSPEVSSTV